jgi:hypothetical protein
MLVVLLGDRAQTTVGRGSGLGESMFRRPGGVAVAERADQVTEWSVLDGGWTAT